MAFQRFLFMWGPHTWLNNINKRLCDLKVSWSPNLVLGLHVAMVYENNPNNHKIWSIWCHEGIHVDFIFICIHIFRCVPQAWCEVNLDRLRLHGLNQHFTRSCKGKSLRCCIPYAFVASTQSHNIHPCNSMMVCSFLIGPCAASKYWHIHCQ
jgi:hypothetical protein